jgi:hypothetical protein
VLAPHLRCVLADRANALLSVIFYLAMRRFGNARLARGRERAAVRWSET